MECNESKDIQTKFKTKCKSEQGSEQSSFLRRHSAYRAISAQHMRIHLMRGGQLLGGWLGLGLVLARLLAGIL